MRMVDSSLVKKMKRVATSTVRQIGVFLFAIAYSFLGVSRVFAGLPAVTNPGNEPDSNDYIAVLQGYGLNIAILIGLFLSVAAFFVVVKNIVAIYSAIAAGQRSWSDLGAHGVMGVVLLVFIVFLLTQSASILSTGSP